LLGIGQISLERCDIIDNDINGCLQTFHELGYVEHVMHTHQGWRQIQLVSHGSKLLENQKQTNVARSRLAFDPKPLHTSHGRDTKIHVVSNCKSQGMTSLVGIVLLAGLGSYQIRLNTMNDFLGPRDKIGAKGHPLTRFDPVQRCMASAAIESFERCHLEILLIAVVVRELTQWQALVPTIPIVHHTRTEHVLKHLVHTLYLIIGLWVIS
jgi:hypothetical protein